CVTAFARGINEVRSAVSLSNIQKAIRPSSSKSWSTTAWSLSETPYFFHTGSVVVFFVKSGVWNDSLPSTLRNGQGVANDHAAEASVFGTDGNSELGISQISCTFR